MTRMTIFSAPKPFTDPHINTIQRNAIQSWMHLGPDVEVFLIGDEEGLAQAAEEFGVRHFPQAATNDAGTPLIGSIFQLARENSSAPLLAYVNGDILLLPGFVEMGERALEQSERFLLVGQRWDLDITEAMDFSPGWDARLAEDARRRGALHPPAGSDYFIYPRTVLQEIPELTVGRAGWDNWVIYHAVSQPWPAVDATPSIMIVHQNHDYAHLPGGKAHYDHHETKANLEAGGGEQNMYMLLDTNRELVAGKIRRPRLRMMRILRWLEMRVNPGRQHGLRWGLTRRLRRWRRKLAGVER